MSRYSILPPLSRAHVSGLAVSFGVIAIFCATIGQSMYHLDKKAVKVQNDAATRRPNDTGSMLHSGPRLTGGRDLIDPSAHSRQVALLPWDRQEWCAISPCLTVSNSTQRALDFPAYERWLQYQQGRWRMPFAPLIHRSRGLHWLAPPTTRDNATIYVRNATHGLKFKSHVAPLPSELPCEFWISAPGTVMLWYNWYLGDYSHWTHDNFAAIVALLDLMSGDDPWLALPYAGLPYKWLSWFDERIRNRVIYYPPNTVICSNNTILLPLNFQGDGQFDWASPATMTLLNRKAHQLHHTASEHQFVVFASRNSRTVKRGRKLINEAEVLAKVRALMREYDRSEQLIIYTGENMTFADQYSIFSSATVIIGPHGSAMANVIWSSSSPGCVKPVHVIEFVGGASSQHVQGPIYRGYYDHEASVPWVVYHMAPFTAKSTRSRCFVDVNDVDKILRLVWGKSDLLQTSAATKCFFAL